MKKYLPYCLGLCIAFSGCKEKATENAVQEKVVSEVLSVDKQIKDLMAMYQEVLKTNPNAVMQLKKESEDKVTAKIETKKELPSASAVKYRSDRKKVCEGDGYGFAQCVKKHLDLQKCLVLELCNYCAYEC